MKNIALLSLIALASCSGVDPYCYQHNCNDSGVDTGTSQDLYRTYPETQDVDAATEANPLSEELSGDDSGVVKPVPVPTLTAQPSPLPVPTPDTIRN